MRRVSYRGNRMAMLGERVSISEVAASLKKKIRHKIPLTKNLPTTTNISG